MALDHGHNPLQISCLFVDRANVFLIGVLLYSSWDNLLASGTSIDFTLYIKQRLCGGGDIDESLQMSFSGNGDIGESSLPRPATLANHPAVTTRSIDPYRDLKLSHSVVLGEGLDSENKQHFDEFLKNKRRLELTNLQTNKHVLVHASVVLITPHYVRVRVQLHGQSFSSKESKQSNKKKIKAGKQSASHLQILTGRYLHRRWPWRSSCHLHQAERPGSVLAIIAVE